MNIVGLIGNLATDVEVKDVSEGKRVGSFLLAIDRPSKDAGADFVRVTVWDKQAELCSQYLGKGNRVGLDGRLRSRSWQDADGTDGQPSRSSQTGSSFSRRRRSVASCRHSVRHCCCIAEEVV